MHLTGIQFTEFVYKKLVSSRSLPTRDLVNLKKFGNIFFRIHQTGDDNPNLKIFLESCIRTKKMGYRVGCVKRRPKDPPLEPWILASPHQSWFLMYSFFIGGDWETRFFACIYMALHCHLIFCDLFFFSDLIEPTDCFEMEKIYISFSGGSKEGISCMHSNTCLRTNSFSIWCV